MIDVYCLVDNECPQDFYHARGDRPSLPDPPGQYYQGRAVQAGISGDLPEQQNSRYHRPRRARGRRLFTVRIRRDSHVPGRQDRPVAARRPGGALDGDSVADVADGRFRSDARPGGAFCPAPRPVGHGRGARSFRRRRQSPDGRHRRAPRPKANISAAMRIRSPTLRPIPGAKIPSGAACATRTIQISSAGSTWWPPGRRSPGPTRSPLGCARAPSRAGANDDRFLLLAQRKQPQDLHDA